MLLLYVCLSESSAKHMNQDFPRLFGKCETKSAKQIEWRNEGHRRKWFDWKMNTHTHTKPSEDEEEIDDKGDCQVSQFHMANATTDICTIPLVGCCCCRCCFLFQYDFHFLAFFWTRIRSLSTFGRSFYFVVVILFLLGTRCGNGAYTTYHIRASPILFIGLVSV